MILDVIGKVLSIAKSAVGGAIGQKIGDVVDAIGTNPEVRKAMLNQEVEMKKIIMEDFEGARQLIREESRSEDPFVRRARPAFLWLFYIVIVFNFVMIPMVSLFREIHVIYPALPSELYQLFGAAFLGYSGFRSWDKHKGNKTKKS